VTQIKIKVETELEPDPSLGLRFRGTLFFELPGEEIDAHYYFLEPEQAESVQDIAAISIYLQIGEEEFTITEKYPVIWSKKTPPRFVYLLQLAGKAILENVIFLNTAPPDDLPITALTRSLTAEVDQKTINAIFAH
jgi:hypothetical protein